MAFPVPVPLKWFGAITGIPDGVCTVIKFHAPISLKAGTTASISFPDGGDPVYKIDLSKGSRPWKHWTDYVIKYLPTDTILATIRRYGSPPDFITFGGETKAQPVLEFLSPPKGELDFPLTWKYQEKEYHWDVVSEDTLKLYDVTAPQTTIAWHQANTKGIRLMMTAAADSIRDKVLVTCVIALQHWTLVEERKARAMDPFTYDLY